MDIKKENSLLKLKIMQLENEKENLSISLRNTAKSLSVLHEENQKLKKGIQSLNNFL